MTIELLIAMTVFIASLIIYKHKTNPIFRFFEKIDNRVNSENWKIKRSKFLRIVQITCYLNLILIIGLTLFNTIEYIYAFNNYQTNGQKWQVTQNIFFLRLNISTFSILFGYLILIIFVFISLRKIQLVVTWIFMVIISPNIIILSPIIIIARMIHVIKRKNQKAYLSTGLALISYLIIVISIMYLHKFGVIPFTYLYLNR